MRIFWSIVWGGMARFSGNVLIVVLFLGSINMASAQESIKKPNVAGQFYPGTMSQLSSDIDQYIDQADILPFQDPVSIIIAPHAGYMFSAPVAAYGFKAASLGNYQTIVILAASHYYGFDGISIGLFDAYETPLGRVSVDRQFAQELIDPEQGREYKAMAFEQEHSLEVEIPFVQKIFPDAKIVPVIFGQPPFSRVEQFASRMAEIIKDRQDVLVVVSTDMSHYHDQKTASGMDQKTIRIIERMDIPALWNGCVSRELELCGFVAVSAAMVYARLQGIDDVRILKYADSSDASGDRARVVGYGAVAFLKKSKSGHAADPVSELNGGSQTMLNKDQQKILLQIARETMEQYIKTGQIKDFQIQDERLLAEEGAFVTLHKKGQLRGCIGHIIGEGPLYLTVRDMAIAASTQDPRFMKVSEKELPEIDLEISVLSKPRRIKDVGEIRMGVHGVIVKGGAFHQGVFLPQVATETGWTKEEFLSQLCAQKAGLTPDAWKDPRTVIEIFTAQVFNEKSVFSK